MRDSESGGILIAVRILGIAPIVDPRAPVETIGVYHLAVQGYELQWKYMHCAHSTTIHQNRLS